MSKSERQWRVRLILGCSTGVAMVVVHLLSMLDIISLDDNYAAFAWFIYVIAMTCIQAMVITYYVRGFQQLPSWWEVAELMTSAACIHFVIFCVGFSVLEEEIPHYELLEFLVVFWLVPIIVMGWIGAGLRGSLKGEMNVPEAEPVSDLLDDHMLRGTNKVEDA